MTSIHFANPQGHNFVPVLVDFSSSRDRRWSVQHFRVENVEKFLEIFPEIC